VPDNADTGGRGVLDPRFATAWSRWAPTATLALVLASATALLAAKARHLWFWGDDWAFLLRYGVRGQHDYGLLDPHNEHWSTVPVLLFRGVFAVFGLRHYLPYGMLPILAHVVTCAALYVLLRRCQVGPWVAVLTVTVLAFFGGGAENLLWDFQVGFLGSAAFGMLALVVASGGEWTRGRVVTIWALALLGLMSSGMGIPLTAWLGLFLLWRRGLRSVVVGVAPPAAVLLLWRVTAGHATQTPRAGLGRTLTFLERALSAAWDAALGVSHGGIVVWLALLVLALLPVVGPELRALAQTGLVTALGAYVLIALSRTSLGLEGATVGRYTYFGVLYSLPAFAVALTLAGNALRRQPVLAAVGSIGVAVFFVVTGGRATDEFATHRETQVAGLRQLVVAASDLAVSDAKLLGEQPLTPANPDIFASRLDDSSVRNALPHVRPGPQARLQVASTLQVALSASPLPVGPAVEVRSSGVIETARTGDCRTGVAQAGARLHVRPGVDGGLVRLTVAGDQVLTQLARRGLRSTLTAWPVTAGGPAYVGTSADGATLDVVLPRGQVSYCVGAAGAG